METEDHANSRLSVTGVKVLLGHTMIHKIFIKNIKRNQAIALTLFYLKSCGILPTVIKNLLNIQNNYNQLFKKKPSFNK